ncbi:MAG: hypothetical protein RL215_2502 [Planctomycetota bacterium]|jgi:hypothetical protein
MPAKNNFGHQSYPTVPAGEVQLRRLTAIAPVERMFSGLHERHRVSRVVLVHGTFMGDDPVGLSATLHALADSLPLGASILRQVSEHLRERTQPAVTRLVRDLGNFTTEFRDLFQHLVGDDPLVEFPSSAWSGENHHYARADLAVALLEQMLARPVPEGQRILLWGHSHAGNAFAILSNLLANDRAAVDAFFAAGGVRTSACWRSVHEQLRRAATPHPLARQLIMATFGTPVRYGWDTAGYAALIHLNFHRVFNPNAPAQAKPVYPFHAPSEILSGEWGDWVQTFAIAGTDTSSLPAISANRQLGQLLESGLSLTDPSQLPLTLRLMPRGGIRDLCARWQHGVRCHSDGLNLLVDYEPSGDRIFPNRPLESAVMGHGVATSIRWLPAHLQQVEIALDELLRTK